MIDLSPLPPLPQPTMHLANAPQLNPVSWAFIIGREESVSPTELLVLVAAAQYAECASWSGEGAGPVHVDVLVQLTGLPTVGVVHVWNGEWAR